MRTSTRPKMIHRFQMIHRRKVFDGPFVENHVGRWSKHAIVNPSLSVRCMFNGLARYRIDAVRTCVVDDRSYLVLNKGQTYDVEKPGLDPVESFCVFFPDAWVAQAVGEHGASLTFRDHSRPHDVAVTPYMLRLREDLQSVDTAHITIEQNALQLLSRLFAADSLTALQADRLHVRRPAARIELHRRLCVARDYLDAHLAEDPSIIAASRSSGLSPFYMIRGFKTLFGRTPNAYVIQRRMHLARQLLLKTNRRVIDIAYEVGYRSHASFSLLFKSNVGCSPQQFRRTFAAKDRNIR